MKSSFKRDIDIIQLNKCKKASLTVEASLVLPIFLYAAMAFLYFFQIFMVQEEIQCGISEMGLDIAKGAYIIQDFSDDSHMKNHTITGQSINEFNDLSDLMNIIYHSFLLKQFSKNYLNEGMINNSCIYGGFEGLDFGYSKVLEEDEHIDIIVQYKVNIPIRIFALSEIPMLQRVKVRGWTGHHVKARYTTDEQKEEEDIVFITETGTVYHLKRDCTYLKLKISNTVGIPDSQRNSNGAKYYSCERCITGEEDISGIFYITTEGTRYHSSVNCSSLKRTIIEVHLSEVNGRNLCKRCGN